MHAEDTSRRTAPRPPAPVAAPGTPGGGSPPHGLVVALGAYALSRALVLGVAWLASRGTPRGWLGALTQWDGAWYTSIVAAWYPGDVAAVAGDALKANLAFFPAYPGLAALVAALPGLGPHGAAVLVANLAGAAATAAVWWSTRLRADPAVATRAGVLFALLPASVILSMAYAEGVMIAAAAVCLGGLLSRRWLLAGAAGALATASRPTAAVLVACAAWQALVAWRRDGDRRALLAPLLTATGGVGCSAYLWARTGEPLAWTRVQTQGWGEHIDFGAETLAGLWRAVTAPNLVDVVDLLAAVVLVVGAVLLVRQRAPALVLLYCAGVVAAPLLSFTLGPRPRFVYVAFPLVVALATALRGRAFRVALAVCTVGLAVLAWLYTGTWLVTP